MATSSTKAVREAISGLMSIRLGGAAVVGCGSSGMVYRGIIAKEVPVSSSARFARHLQPPQTVPLRTAGSPARLV